MRRRACDLLKNPDFVWKSKDGIVHVNYPLKTKALACSSCGKGCLAEKRTS